MIWTFVDLLEEKDWRPDLSANKYSNTGRKIVNRVRKKEQHDYIV